tara:strand:+ start:433 stop:618 length:186 start_codon:yes stop_codon:yes gene_type:complete
MKKFIRNVLRTLVFITLTPLVLAVYIPICFILDFIYEENIALFLVEQIREAWSYLCEGWGL